MATSVKAGDRVELSPGRDEWMSGDRFGTVTGQELLGGVGVKLDRTGRTVYCKPEELTLVDEALEDDYWGLLQEVFAEHDASSDDDWPGDPLEAGTQASYAFQQDLLGWPDWDEAPEEIKQFWRATFGAGLDIMVRMLGRLIGAEDVQAVILAERKAIEFTMTGVMPGGLEGEMLPVTDGNGEYTSEFLRSLRGGLS